MPSMPSSTDNKGGGVSIKHRMLYSDVVPIRPDRGDDGSMKEMVSIRKADSKIDASG